MVAPSRQCLVHDGARHGLSARTPRCKPSVVQTVRGANRPCMVSSMMDLSWVHTSCLVCLTAVVVNYPWPAYCRYCHTEGYWVGMRTHPLTHRVTLGRHDTVKKTYPIPIGHSCTIN